tara:strand:+ start:619 stop:798 length:180 start_codon:yes stop_codon:yes gene_type:complete
MLKIKLTKSPIGHKPKAKATILALGLKKLNHFVIKKDTAQIRGMIKKVEFLVKVSEVKI